MIKRIGEKYVYKNLGFFLFIGYGIGWGVGSTRRIHPKTIKGNRRNRF